MDFENRLRLSRIKRGLTQQQLSERIDTSLRNYQCYEQGRRRPKYEALVDIADALGVTTDYLLGRTGEAPSGE